METKKFGVKSVQKGKMFDGKVEALIGDEIVTSLIINNKKYTNLFEKCLGVTNSEDMFKNLAYSTANSELLEFIISVAKTICIRQDLKIGEPEAQIKIPNINQEYSKAVDVEFDKLVELINSEDLTLEKLKHQYDIYKDRVERLVYDGFCD